MPKKLTIILNVIFELMNNCTIECDSALSAFNASFHKFFNAIFLRTLVQFDSLFTKFYKINQTFVSTKFVWMTRSVLFLILLPLLVSSFRGHNHHPYYVSVTEIEYINTNKEIGIACKIFTDDFEQALKGMYQTKVDLYNTKDTSLAGKQIAGYIKKHLQLTAGDKQVTLQYLGFEIEGEAAWCYFSAGNIAPFQQLRVFNDLLYEYKKEQVNLMHVRVNGNRKSGRLSAPDNRLNFDF